ncbi:Phage HNH homing endonuclease [Pseudomonas sp. R4-39-08]|uniref:HNH endonuclease signature motif containing protein n=1 Tax=Pseudomonas sp. R4-39-08 TaxID=1173288 RepID=UPI000F6D292C|nr:HNH endonuclease signature motif containing protein [Pseudomonas sp. R4-39-08]AZF37722.1 Phage HNH homing endonuclease [Pseudomonas sp. R4-39-08]
MSERIYRNEVSVETVRSLLSYEPLTGSFKWIEKPSWGVSVGEIAGFITSAGYRSIRIAGAGYQAHRLAWLHHYGEWPANELDHINGNKDDNRIANLRDVNRKGNCENQRRPQRNNTSGFLGVSWAKNEKKWKAQISHGGKKRAIGYFDSPEKAHEAYLAVKRELHAGCTL